MAEPDAAAADLAVDVAAHHGVVLAAKERHEAVLAPQELGEKIAVKFTGAADAVGQVGGVSGPS